MRIGFKAYCGSRTRTVNTVACCGVSMRVTVRMLADGKVTIPKPVREELELERGDAVELEVINDE